jgi:hypothetical protein
MYLTCLRRGFLRAYPDLQTGYNTRQTGYNTTQIEYNTTQTKLRNEELQNLQGPSSSNIIRVIKAGEGIAPEM